jgi:hypothetical protein
MGNPSREKMAHRQGVEPWKNRFGDESEATSRCVAEFQREEFCAAGQPDLFYLDFMVITQLLVPGFSAAGFLALSFLREKLFTSRPAITVQPAGRVPVVVPPLPLAIRRSPYPALALYRVEHPHSQQPVATDKLTRLIASS